MTHPSPSSSRSRTASLHDGGGRAGRARSATIVLLVATLVLLAMVPVSVHATLPSPPTGALPAAEKSIPDPVASVNCSTLQAGWDQVDEGSLAPEIAPSLQGPCVVGHDVPSLYFVSNQSTSGSRFEMEIGLPSASSSPASAYEAFWVGAWLAGVPCSYNGASYLTVDLLPPYTSAPGVASSRNWSLVAPVWSLVSPGTCDPQCTNDTAFFTIDGRSYCEDDAVLQGIGSLGGAATDRFSPGDILTLTLDGTVGASTPMQVYLNDTVHTAESLTWNYSPGIRGNGPWPSGGGTPPVTPPQALNTRPLTPYYAAASAQNGGWTGGLDVGFGWANCPAVPTAGVPVCDSYNAPMVAAAGTPTVLRVDSWNQSQHAYVDPYRYVATLSSSGGCSGASDVAPCVDFATEGGSGVYPTYSIAARDGLSWFEYGGVGTDLLSEFGGTLAQFPLNGTLSALQLPTTLSNVSTQVGSSSVTVRLRATDPNGVSQVLVGDWWCGTGGGRVPTTVVAALTAAPGNSLFDGNWSASLPTNGYVGRLYYTVSARSLSETTTPPWAANLTVTGTGGTCGATAPPSPSLNVSAISPIGGGYSITWSENTSSGVRAYSVSATPSGGGTPTLYSFGNVTHARLNGLLGRTTYSLEVGATNPAGLTSLSGPVTASSATYLPLATRPLNVTASSSWVNRTTADIVANATGGLPPFTYLFSFGDGNHTSVFTTSGDASVIHAFSHNYSGIAVLDVTVEDSAGDRAIPPTAYLPVESTPQGVLATARGGDGFVEVNWTAPVGPPGVAIYGYQILWTTDAAWAPYLGAAWPNGSEFPEIRSAWALPDTTLFSFPDPNGVTAYAQVTAWNAYGSGLLPPGPANGAVPYLTATAEPFASYGILLSVPGGGPAPFTENFSTQLSCGSGTLAVNATYRFSDGGSVAAPIYSDPTSGTFWANASYTFLTPGTENVYLYALDSLSELESPLATTSLYVSPSSGPVVRFSSSPTPAFVNESVGFSAGASGGSSEYSYTWQFGDGTNGTGASTVHEYSLSGVYEVGVTVIDLLYGGSTTETATITVYGPPTVAIGAVPTGTAGTFALAAFAEGFYDGPLSFTWLFGDGDTAQGANITHTWAQAGTYNVTVRATDAAGHITVTSTNLTVTYPGPSTSGGSSSGISVLDIVLIAALGALAIAVVFLLFRRSRGGPPAPTIGPAEADDMPERPAPNLEEESPPNIR